SGNPPPTGANHDGRTAAIPPMTAAPPGAVSVGRRARAPFPLNPAAAKSAKTPATPAKKEEPKDTFRELIETIVFVVVLVLMLKTFLAEAFVIPTGSMATTLLGYHYKVVCEKCGYTNLINASSEADPQDGRKVDVVNCRCENCRAWNRR